MIGTKACEDKHNKHNHHKGKKKKKNRYRFVTSL